MPLADHQPPQAAQQAPKTLRYLPPQQQQQRQRQRQRQRSELNKPLAPVSVGSMMTFEGTENRRKTQQQQQQQQQSHLQHMQRSTMQSHIPAVPLAVSEPLIVGSAPLLQHHLPRRHHSGRSASLGTPALVVPPQANRAPPLQPPRAQGPQLPPSGRASAMEEGELPPDEQLLQRSSSPRSGGGALKGAAEELLFRTCGGAEWEPPPKRHRTTAALSCDGQLLGSRQRYDWGDAPYPGESLPTDLLPRADSEASRDYPSLGARPPRIVHDLPALHQTRSPHPDRALHGGEFIPSGLPPHLDGAADWDHHTPHRSVRLDSGGGVPVSGVHASPGTHLEPADVCGQFEDFDADDRPTQQILSASWCSPGNRRSRHLLPPDPTPANLQPLRAPADWDGSSHRLGHDLHPCGLPVPADWDALRHSSAEWDQPARQHSHPSDCQAAPAVLGEPEGAPHSASEWDQGDSHRRLPQLLQRAGPSAGADRGRDGSLEAQQVVPESPVYRTGDGGSHDAGCHDARTSPPALHAPLLPLQQQQKNKKKQKKGAKQRRRQRLQQQQQQQLLEQSSGSKLPEQIGTDSGRAGSAGAGGEAAHAGETATVQRSKTGKVGERGSSQDALQRPQLSIVDRLKLPLDVR